MHQIALSTGAGRCRGLGCHHQLRLPIRSRGTCWTFCPCWPRLGADHV